MTPFEKRSTHVHAVGKKRENVPLCTARVSTQPSVLFQLPEMSASLYTSFVTYTNILNTEHSSCLIFLLNDWCFPGCWSENFLFSVIPCILFSPWLTRSSPQRILLLNCKPQKDISAWMPASKRQRTIAKQLQLLFTRGTLTVGTVPWGGRGNKMQKPQQMGLILCAEIMLLSKYFWTANFKGWQG